jgi:hypothetical protein
MIRRQEQNILAATVQKSFIFFVYNCEKYNMMLLALATNINSADLPGNISISLPKILFSEIT